MNYYNEIASGYNELHKEEQFKKLKIIQENLEVSGKLLDIGAGTGISTKPFLEKATCFSLDPSEELLKQSEGIKVLGSAEELPFNDNTFDVIISVSAIHHFDLTKAIPEIKRVSKENTKYAFTILKKSENFENIKKILKENFKLREFDEEKDLILIT